MSYPLYFRQTERKLDNFFIVLVKTKKLAITHNLNQKKSNVFCIFTRAPLLANPEVTSVWIIQLEMWFRSVLQVIGSQTQTNKTIVSIK